MTLEVPYYTGLILALGFVLIPIVAIAVWGLIQLDRKKKK
jgi:hypothetical protein